MHAGDLSRQRHVAGSPSAEARMRPRHRRWRWLDRSNRCPRGSAISLSCKGCIKQREQRRDLRTSRRATILSRTFNPHARGDGDGWKSAAEVRGLSGLRSIRFNAIEPPARRHAAVRERGIVERGQFHLFLERGRLQEVRGDHVRSRH